MAVRFNASTPRIPNRGKCQMCGGEDRDRWMLFIGDYAGWTCIECISQVQKSQERRYIAVGEHTESAE